MLCNSLECLIEIPHQQTRLPNDDDYKSSCQMHSALKLLFETKELGNQMNLMSQLISIELDSFFFGSEQCYFYSMYHKKNKPN